MTAVYQRLDIEAKFSDAAACSEILGDIPDIICLESFGNVLLVGRGGIMIWLECIQAQCS